MLGENGELDRACRPTGRVKGANAPVDAFEPRGYGIHNAAGNIWEWCADRFSPHHALTATVGPQGPRGGTSKVIRGCSCLCHPSYCNRYRFAARTANAPDSSTGNMGFR